jgi:RNA-binding protein
MLTKAQIRELKGKAQRLPATLTLGKEGLTDSFLAEARTRFKNASLVKVRLGAFQEERHAMAKEMATKTESELITVVGHVVVLFRPVPEAPDLEASEA